MDFAEIRRSVEAERWKVATSAVDDSVHVYPVRGMITVEGFGRYPRTERGVARAIRRTQRWCDRQNRKLDAGQALLRKVRSDG